MFFFLLINCSVSPRVEGELKTWHKITLTFDGPQIGELENPNPFLFYRLNVQFINGEKSYNVPGYYAADGDAANTSATSGNKCRVHFAPDIPGVWTYKVSFRQGENIAVKDEAGESAGFMDGSMGSFEVTATDKTGRDFRSKGRLNYVGKHYLQFAGTGEYFLKAGADAPENFLSYRGFDGDFKTDGHKDELVKDWEAHVKDWQPGDPLWQGGKGKGIIGAINYLASKGMNVFSFITMNIQGDDQNIFPYTSYDERFRMDISKLAQWEIVFEHADKLGLYLHFKTQEVECQRLLDDGALGIQRKLYYRELIARFSHHLALNWNVGEENGSWKKWNGQTSQQRRAMAEYFHRYDPYQHHIVIHNGQLFDDLLGGQSQLTGVSYQTDKTDFSTVHKVVLTWLKKSDDAGKPWVVAVDEPGDPKHALLPDNENPDHDNARKNGLWGAFFAGGAGIEWYFGYGHAHSDLTCQDWRSRDKMWNQCKIALDFFSENKIPFWTMKNGDSLCSVDGSYVFFKKSEIYLVYLKNGEEAQLDLSHDNKSFKLKWFNPRDSNFYSDEILIQGGQRVDLGLPPGNDKKDWIAVLKSTKF